jgi:hypothetical protein
MSRAPYVIVPLRPWAPLEEQISRIVDLSVPIGEDTVNPPSVNAKLTLTRFHRGPGF